MSLRSSFRQPVQKATTPIIPSSRPQFHIASSSDSDEETGGSSTGVPNENDVVLQSCGILVTGAGLRTTGNKCGSCPFTEDETSLISVENSVCDSGVPPSQHNKMTDIMYSNIIPDSDEFPEGSEGANGSPNEVKLRTRTPEIFISKDDDSSTVTVMEDMMKVAFQQRLSHSTEDISISSVLSTVDSVVVEGNVDSSSALEVGLLPMKTSHSEGAIKDFNTAKDSQVRNPVVGVGSSAIHKDAVLAPFTKLAKGVQSLGLNIHRATSRQARYQEESTSENNEIQKLKQQNCQTRIIEL